MGRQAFEHAAASFSSVASSSFDPVRTRAAAGTKIAVGATAPRQTRALAMAPRFNVMLIPTPTTAMSISVRGMNRR